MAASSPSFGHTRVSYRRAPNFLERVGGSFCGSLVGLGLIAAACILLFLNEVALGLPYSPSPLTCFSLAQGRSVHRYDMLVETRQLCNSVENPESVYGELDGKLVHVSGKLATSSALSDGYFGVTGDAASQRN